MHKFVSQIQVEAEKHLNNLHSKVRSAVSKDKYRFQDGTFDLDLTYINERIIAMGFPGTSLEKAWRNSKDDVSNFLQHYHNNHYLVINVSERVYDSAGFQNLRYFGWPDHSPPSLEVLLQCVTTIHEFLSADPLNVVAIHCMAGRGRTGTVIAAYFLYIKMFSNANEALDFFASRRSATSEGVQVPSQRRYVDYFRQIIDSCGEGDAPNLPIPTKLKLKCVMMRPVLENFDLTGDFTPVLVVECFSPVQPCILYTNEASNLRTFVPKDGAIVMETKDLPVEGDIMIRIHSSSVIDSLSEKPIFRFAFNTSFIHGYMIDFTRDQLDSGGAGPLRDDRVPTEFCVRLIFS